MIFRLGLGVLEALLTSLDHLGEVAMSHHRDGRDATTHQVLPAAATIAATTAIVLVVTTGVTIGMERQSVALWSTLNQRRRGSKIPQL